MENKSCILSILNDYQYVISVRSHHYLVFLRSHSKEGEIVGGVELLEHGLGLVHEIVEEAAVLHRGGVVQRGLDGHAVRFDNDVADNALVSHKPLQRLLDL